MSKAYHRKEKLVVPGPQRAPLTGVCEDCGHGQDDGISTRWVGGKGMPHREQCEFCWMSPRPSPMLSLRSAL